jgi:ribonuclease D
MDRIAESAPVAKVGDETASDEEADKPCWPLAYKLHPPSQQPGQQSLQTFGFDSAHPVQKYWWSHKLYKGPANKPVRILYSKTKADSETIAKQFLDESVIGFDMEWPWNDYKKEGLQNKIGLIQVCTEDKIGLFHIGLHPGKTVDDIIAPSLRKIIESPEIGKLGVGVLWADFARLKRFFHLKPKGAVELSHLYRLVKFGKDKPQYVSTKLMSLARLVEDQLGHPLYKGDVRTSNWSKPLSKDQIDYAAGDAYAGYMLYHCMNYKRLQMKPMPPMPIHADKYQESKRSGICPLILQGQSEDGTPLTSESFFRVSMGDTIASKASKTKVSTPKAPTIPKELADDATSQALYNELVLRRISLAAKAGVPVYRVITNPVLVSLALQRPVEKAQLLAIKGIGVKQQETYGDIWLEVISQFLDPKKLPSTTLATTSTSKTSKPLQEPAGEPPSTPNRPSRRPCYRGEDSPDSSPAFGSPIERTPQLHTGLSFTMAETNLDTEEPDSDDSLPSLDYDTAPTLPPARLKRKRTESPFKGATKTASQRLQQLTEAAVLPTTPTKPTSLAITPLTPHSKLARNKLLAFSKLVTRKITSKSPGAPPIVSDRTLSLIIVRAPQTMEELERIPGIDSFLLACEQTGSDLMRNVLKFTAK